jgi:DNA-directed RNA polymerase specialized sigma24 family protein
MGVDNRRQRTRGSAPPAPVLLVTIVVDVRVHSRAVFDPAAPSSMSAIEEFRKEKVRTSIYRYAVWRSRSDADGEDLVADALILVLDPDRRPWDPAKRSFKRHMRLVVDHIAIDRARSGYARFEVVDSAPTEDAASTEALAEEALAEHTDVAGLRHLGGMLLARLEQRDDLAARVLRAACGGIEEPAELAKALGCGVDEIYEAMRRLKYHAARVKAEAEQAKAAQMKSARERAIKTGSK